ncbi:MAG: ABC transporter permease [Spirochaetales bacterium]|nr:ABC transporter permease [Spirochaetales bacterium]
MFGFIVRRILWAVPVIIVISIISFGLMHAVPGNPFDQETDKPLPPAIVERLTAYYGLDDPVPKQYLDYVINALKGDLGPSYQYRDRTVNTIIARNFPVSLKLGLLGLSVALVIGVPLGIVSALRQNTAVDYFAMFFAISGVSVPAMTMGPLLIWIFALQLGILPVARWGSWQQAILPMITLGIGGAAILARLTRASMLQVIREDYIRTARAKGVSERMVTIKHALRNALIPVVTVLGPMLAGIVTGSMIVERIFAIPGMGRFYVDAVSSRDYPVIMGMTLVYAVLLVTANLIVDITYSWIDPRIRIEER